MIQRVIFLGKGIVTLSLVMVFVLAIGKEYRAVKPLWKMTVKNLDRLIDPEEIQAKARLNTLNNYMPASYQPLLEFVESHGAKNNGKIQNHYVDYYEKIVEFMPQNADAHALLGFCYYHLAEPQKAIAAYQKAVALNPQFFWSAYSLGVIYFQNQKYPQASAVLSSAISSSVDATLTLLYRSRVYQPLIAIADKDLPSRLRKGYENAYVLLVLSQYRQKKFAEVIKSCRAAIKADFEHKYFFYEYLGAALDAVGEKGLAVQALQQAIVLKQTAVSRLSLPEDIALEVF
ncbi:MAG: hypothetical protein A2787_02575 [Omnitrophica WOR_2 bacterium RIFCSPHIGHO2_01_FULL_48_9]|nr:MAG: hypothetical protein A2787_02575 [Omnitrophica WOR_2 bacterium RIFCSPHIGHO2_01_FULL_48_9]